MPARTDEAAEVAAAAGGAALAAANPETAITRGNDAGCDAALARLPDRVETENLRTLG